MIVERIESGDRLRVVLAFGTTSPNRPRGAYDAVVSDRTPAPSSGLKHRTLFQLDRRLSVSITNSGFDVSGRTGPPVLGHLDIPALRRLQSVRARIHAQPDIAAVLRRERVRQAQDRRRAGELGNRPTPFLQVPRWRAIPQQERPMVEHRNPPDRPVLRLVADASAAVSSKPTTATEDVSPTPTSAQPTFTVQRPTTPGSAVIPDASR